MKTSNIFDYGIVVICSILLVQCAGVTPEEKRQLEIDQLAVEVSDEVTVGRQMAARLMGHFGAYDGNKKSLEYVNLVGQTMAKCVGRPEIKYHFGILKMDEVNAFATPGGYVFISRGLLSNIKDESELAAVLSHEIAHINEKHMYREIAPKRDMTTGETVARFMSRGRSELGSSLSTIVSKGLKMLLETGLDKQVELEADEAAAVYTASCGYNPAALLALLKRVERKHKVKYSKTHPKPDERIAFIQKAIQRNGLRNKMAANGNVLAARFRKALASFH